MPIENKKLYVLVRKDLNTSYQAVQAGHAVAEWLLHDQSWQNNTLIYLGVKDESELIYWANKLEYKGIKYVGFKEPDIGNELTAIAAHTDNKIFNRLRLI